MPFPTTAGNLPANHASGQTITSANQNNVETDVNALTVKAGTGSSTPTTGTVFRGTGTGVSAWGALASSDLPLMAASGVGHQAGAVVDPGSVAGTGRYWREDATWAAPAGSSTVVDVRLLGAAGNGVADDTTIIQNAINGATAGSTVYFAPTTNYYKISSTLTINKPLRISASGAEIRQVTSGQGGFSITSGGVVIDSPTLTGPQFATFVSTEIGISISGTAGNGVGAPTYISGIKLEDCTVQSWGGWGIKMSYVSAFLVTNSTIQNIWLAGFAGNSVKDGRLTENKVDSILRDQVQNQDCYGITFGRDTTLTYNSAPAPANVVVANNTVSNVPSWVGLDTHGGQDLLFIGNKVINCFLGGSSQSVKNADAEGSVYVYAPKRVQWVGNTFISGLSDTTRGDGTTATSQAMAVCGVQQAQEAQTVSITGAPTGGTFTLSFGGQTTSGIASTATAATVQTALTGLSSIGTGNLVAFGGPLPANPVTVRFQGTLATGRQNIIAAVSSLTGGTTPAIAVQRVSMAEDCTCIGNVFVGYAPPNAGSGAVLFYGTEGMVCSANVIRDSGVSAIIWNDHNYDAACTSNSIIDVWTSVTNPGGTGIWLGPNSQTTNTVLIEDNVFTTAGRTATGAAVSLNTYAIRVSDPSANRARIGMNQADAWTNPVALDTAACALGAQMQPRWSAAPTVGTWKLGDVMWNNAPASAGFIGWVCTVAGTPGTWKTFGLIS